MFIYASTRPRASGLAGSSGVCGGVCRVVAPAAEQISRYRKVRARCPVSESLPGRRSGRIADDVPCRRSADVLGPYPARPPCSSSPAWRIGNCLPRPAALLKLAGLAHRDPGGLPHPDRAASPRPGCLALSRLAARRAGKAWAVAE